MFPVLMLAMLEAPLNQVIALDPASPQRLAALEHKPLKILVTPMQWSLVMSVDNQRLRLSTEGEAAITLSGAMHEFAQVALSNGDMAAGTLQVQGDVGAAQRWQQFFSELAPDYEEQLAKLVGDIPAHQMGKVIRSVQQGLALLLKNVSEASTEYLQEEGRFLVTKVELSHFLDDVDQLRARVDRILAKANQQGVRV